MSTVEEHTTTARARVSAGRRKLQELASTKSAHATILMLYAISVAWPIRLQLGPAYITMSRLLIIVLLIPMLLRLFSGRYGGIKLPDYLVIFYCIWAYIALSANHGAGTVSEFAVMFFVETTGAYLVGRIYIRNRADFFCFIKYLLIIAMISIPFVIVEMKTGRPVIIEFIRSVNPAPDIIRLPGNVNYEKRIGLERSQFTLGHPILYGVFCSSLMALALTVRTQNMGVFAKTFWGVVVAASTFASLSSAAFLSALLQLAILGFERTTRMIKARWKLLAAAFVAAYIVVDILSNRSPIVVFVSVFSFSPATAYNRILIWEFGSAEVWRHPIFGIGNNDWVRPSWMVPSIDNHWLLQTMRYGLPGGVALMTAVLWILIKVGRSKIGENIDLIIVKRGYMAGLIGWCIALGTVAINVEVNSYFMTLLAGGIWIIDEAQRNGADPIDDDPRRRRNRRKQPAGADLNRGERGKTAVSMAERGRPKRAPRSDVASRRRQLRR